MAVMKLKKDSVTQFCYSHIFSLKVHFLLNKKLLTEAMVTPTKSEKLYGMPDSL